MTIVQDCITKLSKVALYLLLKAHSAKLLDYVVKWIYIFCCIKPGSKKKTPSENIHKNVSY